ncbi:peptide chain release factor N(5)-glutamine methyltransferase [Roseicyclus sp.]|uniref:peptide chain release factor N(5)-glutamine methyltransferase n=1 Tax=Roseicyclus sp. TaxID=1914329 RepID=UPI003F6D7D97
MSGSHDAPLTLGLWLRMAHARLAPVIGPDEAARDLRRIAMHATGLSAAQLGIGGGDVLAPAAQAAADAMLAARLAHRPLAQILGAWPFYGRSFHVTQDTLVPRPDTETLIELALERPFSRMVDLGTGSGAIAVTLLAERADALGLASDISQAALEVAARNAQRHGVAARLDLRHADWWDGLAGVFDLIVSNPPYVTQADYARLAPEITQWEPRAALTPGGDGLAAYRQILGGLGPYLAAGGRCLVEIGAEQGRDVAAIFVAAGLVDVAVHADINGKDRVVSGRRGQ